MPVIKFQNRDYTVNAGESVLETLLRHGVTINYSCRSGICQSCMMKANKGTLDAKSQQGLKETLKAQNYFLSCSCFPSDDMEISAATDVNRFFKTNVLSVTPLSESVLQIRLSIPVDFTFRSGQFINLFIDETTSRSYSIASLPENGYLELHVRKFEQGKVSTWFFEKCKRGDQLKISEPQGNCFYIKSKIEQPLLLIATGTGLAPIYGIVNDALKHGHTGEIWLYHGARNLADLYFKDELNELGKSNNNFHYHACLSGEAANGCRNGRASEVALADHPNLKNWRAFLCGNPEMVKDTKKSVFLAGASFSEIYADPFVTLKPLDVSKN